MEVDIIVLLAQMPDWYQELSNEQVYLLENLHTYLRQDALELYCPQTSRFLDNLGIFPPLSVLIISTSLQKSKYRALKFLEYVAKDLSHRGSDKLTGHEYSANERLVYSSICHLLYPDLINKLDDLLPTNQRRFPETAADFQYITLSPKPDTSSPYLSVPEILQRNKLIAIEHNKRVREKRKPLLKLLTIVTYKQDIINEIINNEIVCDRKLKYQYGKGKKQFSILKKKFYELEEERKDLETKLYPKYTFIKKTLNYEMFELLEESKMKKLNKNNDEAFENESFISSLTGSSISSMSNIGLEMDASGTSLMFINSQTSLAVFPITRKTEYFTKSIKNATVVLNAENNNIPVANIKKISDVFTKSKGDAESESLKREENIEPDSDVRSSDETNVDPTESHSYSEEESSPRIGKNCSDPDLCENSSESSASVDRSGSSDLLFDVSEPEFRRKLLRLKPKLQLEAAIRYLTYRNEYLELLPSLKDLPKLKVWYEMRTKQPVERSKLHFRIPDADDFEERLKGIKTFQIHLPKIRRAKVDRKALCEEIERTKALFSRQLKLRQIELSRELFTLYNVECLRHDLDRKKFKRLFFAMFPNREKDVLIKK